VTAWTHTGISCRPCTCPCIAPCGALPPQVCTLASVQGSMLNALLQGASASQNGGHLDPWRTLSPSFVVRGVLPQLQTLFGGSWLMLCMHVVHPAFLDWVLALACSCLCCCIAGSGAGAGCLPVCLAPGLQAVCWVWLVPRVSEGSPPHLSETAPACACCKGRLLRTQGESPESPLSLLGNKVAPA